MSTDTAGIIAALKQVEAALKAGITTTIATGDIEIGAVELKDGATDVRATIVAANAAKTTATVALSTQPIDAAGNVLGRTAANTARTTATLVDPVQIVSAAGAVDTLTTVTTVGTVSAVSAITAAAATNKVDVGLINAVTPLMGNGASGTGAIRVALVSDGTGRMATLDTLTSGNVGGFTTLVQSTVVMSVAGAYATGDYMGTTTSPQSFASAVRVSGGTGVIKSILISDKITTTNVAMELWIIDRTYTAPTDNAAWDFSDANMLFVQAVIPISTTGWYASSAGQVYVDGSLSFPIKISTGTSLFYALVARGTTPAFTSSDLTITLGILQD